MILVISHPQDLHANAVLDPLRTLGAPVQLLNLAEFPRQLRLSIDAGSGGAAGPDYRSRLAWGEGLPPLSLDEVGAIWWRRPQTLTVHDEITRPSHRSFAFNECTEALSGLWQTLGAHWINHPTRDEVAGRKALQLQLAQRCGLTIPRTCITNDPATARAFIDREGAGRVICKSFSATHADWRETRLVSAAELDRLDTVCAAPVIFQQYIDADVDLRVTVVGDHCFAAAIHSQQTRYRVDFRMDMERAEVTAERLPAEVERGLQALMRTLGLVYGAIDLRRTPQGEHVFLEINPAGQFLFVEEKTGQPIARTLAQALMDRDRTQATRGPKPSRDGAVPTDRAPKGKERGNRAPRRAAVRGCSA